jgi:transcriptional regulator with XRE-family HTH domain
MSSTTARIGSLVPGRLRVRLLGSRKRAFLHHQVRLDKLAELTDSSESYISELENRDEPRPSADKITRIAAALAVTPDFLLTAPEATPDAAVADQAFFRKYQGMSDQDKKRLRQILDAWERDP